MVVRYGGGVIGSSPRVRGTAFMSSDDTSFTRFIPAGAGNGLAMSLLRELWSVHPRGCGERPSMISMIDTRCGSSPRVRGTAYKCLPMPILHRFIPAGAGNGVWLSPCAGRRPVHPRGCGERLLDLEVLVDLAGSSPRVRGTVGDDLVRPFHRRFIPAGAGNG